MAVFEEIVAHLKVQDDATGAFGKISNSIGKGVDKLTHFGTELTKIAGLAGGVGAALSFFNAVESTEKYMGNLKEIVELTGMQADRTDYLLSSARQAGIEYDTMQSIIFRMSRRGAAMEASINGSNDAAKSMSQKFHKLGIDMTKGPEASLAQMAALVNKGKIGVDDLMGRFGIPAKAANDFKGFLEDMGASAKKGEKLNEFQKKFQQLKADGSLVTTLDLETFQRIEKLKHSIADGFNRIKLTLGTQVLPIIEDMLRRFEENLPMWIDKVREFGRFLEDHMETGIKLAKILGKVLLANAVISSLSGGNQTLASLVKSAPALGSGLVKGIAAAFPKLGQLGAGVGMGVMSAAGGGLANAGPVAGALGSMAGSFVVLLPVLVAVAAIVGTLALAFYGFKNNVGGVRDTLMEMWDPFLAKLQIVGQALAPLGQWMTTHFGGDGTMATFFQTIASNVVLTAFSVIDKAVEGWVLLGYVIGETKQIFDDFWSSTKRALKTQVFDPFVQMLTTIGNIILAIKEGRLRDAFELSKFKGQQAINANPAGLVVESALDSLASGLERAQAAMRRDVDAQAARNKAERTMEKKEKTVDEKTPPKTEMNFPNARFDITQNFAEGFDPDRVAVAFAQDLSELGELRTQSGLGPAFAGR